MKTMTARRIPSTTRVNFKQRELEKEKKEVGKGKERIWQFFLKLLLEVFVALLLEECEWGIL